MMLAGVLPEHPLGLDPDRMDLLGVGVDRHHRGLGDHDARPRT